MCEKCINICNCNCKNYQITYDVWLNKWYCKKCKCEVDNKLIEKICGYCNKPVIKCSYSEMDYGIKPEHLLYYTNTLCFNNGEKHYCNRSCAVSDLEIYDSKIIGKIKEVDKS